MTQAVDDPVRRRVIDALARRADAQPPGALRERLLQTLARRTEAVAAPTPPARPANTASPLTALLAQLNKGADAELRNVHAHRATWNALRLSRRMAELSAPAPAHLGPLNSQVLVTRALQHLHALSPAYLQRLLAQLDALAALAPLQAAAESKPARRAAPKRR